MAAPTQPGKRRTRVYLADDHPVFRRGLSRIVRERPELELVGESADGRQALADIAELRPDVALLDVRMPHLDGTEVLRAVRREGLPTRVVFLSAMFDGEAVYRALAEGASAYLAKTAEPEQIFEAIGMALRGEVVIPPELQPGLAKEIRMREAGGRGLLSPRELEVLKLVAEGCSAAEAGRRLQLGTTTVKTHLRNLYEKLEVSDRAAAVAEAMRRGLLE